MSRWVGVAIVACCMLVVTCSGSKHGPTPGDGAGPPCTGDGMCPPDFPYCDTHAGVCVECVGDANCGSGRFCSMVEQCVHCLTDTQCSGGMPHCTVGGDCVECIDASHCGSGETCNTSTQRCVAGCGSNGDCRAPNPVCDTTRMYCVGCVQSTDCPAGDMHICDTSDGTCIGCLQDADCTTAPRLKCSPAQACVQCITTADCPTGHSCQFGTCR